MLKKFLIWLLSWPDFKNATGETAILLGRYAESALSNPAIGEAFKRVEDSLKNKWSMTAPKEADTREKIYYNIQALAQVRLMLRGMVNDMIIEEKNNEGQS